MHFSMSTSKGRGHFNVSTVLNQVTIGTVSETSLSCPAAPLVVLGTQRWPDFSCGVLTSRTVHSDGFSG